MKLNSLCLCVCTYRKVCAALCVNARLAVLDFPATGKKKKNTQKQKHDCFENEDKSGAKNKVQPLPSSSFFPNVLEHMYCMNI